MRTLSEVERRQRLIIYLELLLVVELILLVCTILLELEVWYRAIGLILYTATRLWQYYLQRLIEGTVLDKHELFEIIQLLIKNKRL